MRGLTSAVRTLAHVVAGILIVWIVLDLLEADPGNTVVSWIHHAADWLAAWSRGLFAVSSRVLQILLDYGIAAVVFLVVGNLVTRRRVG
ncbi:hypothetical protein [Kitasatospora sp. NPDC088346]|uniref:hypothetical protein n=1 Tax=Kitasatospora sp. NPDC088346 TaxID=3364073 RepID=UPI0037F4CEAF